MMHAMLIVKNNINAENLSLFEERFENGYDIVNDTNLNCLLRIYRDIIKMNEKHSNKFSRKSRKGNEVKFEKCSLSFVFQKKGYIHLELF